MTSTHCWNGEACANRDCFVSYTSFGDKLQNAHSLGNEDSFLWCFVFAYLSRMCSLLALAQYVHFAGLQALEGYFFRSLQGVLVGMKLVRG